jgi:hypothetical protein
MIFPLGCIRASGFPARLARMGPHLPSKSNMPSEKFFPKGQKTQPRQIKSFAPLYRLRFNDSRNHKCRDTIYTAVEFDDLIG